MFPAPTRGEGEGALQGSGRNTTSNCERDYLKGLSDREQEHPRIILVGHDHNIPDRFFF